MARKRILQVVIYRADGSYWSAWQCPWCGCQWSTRPDVLARCSSMRCGAVVERGGWASVAIVDEPTPVVD